MTGGAAAQSSCATAQGRESTPEPMTVVRDYVRARRERVPTPLYGRASVRVTLCSLVVGNNSVRAARTEARVRTPRGTSLLGGRKWVPRGSDSLASTRGFSLDCLLIGSARLDRQLRIITGKTRDAAAGVIIT
jgi:hypothetical protein